MPDYSASVYDTPYTRMVLLTITAQVSGGDLGYLLHKKPGPIALVSICPSGRLTCFITRKLARDRAQVALLLDVDPVGLVRGRAHGGGEGFARSICQRPALCCFVIAERRDPRVCSALR